MEEHGINSATLIVHSAKSRDSITWPQDSTLRCKIGGSKTQVTGTSTGRCATDK